MLRLVARYGDRIRHFPFPSGEAILGSAAGSDMVLPFPGVSGRHARLRGLGREVLLVDLGSKNGLVLAGQRLPWVLLSRGNEVQLGRAFLRLEDAASSEAELGIAFSGGLSSAGGSELPTASVLLEPPTRSAGAALRFLRKIETTGTTLRPGDVRLASARVILGAETLLVFRTVGEDVTIVACHGKLPSERVTRILSRAGAASMTQEKVLVGAGEPGALRLAAVFAGRTPEDWEEDFFAYLSQRFGTDRSSVPSGEADPQPHLRLPPEMIPGESPAFAALLADLEAAARGQLDVLLLGETGTGKELLAKALHVSGPFVALNCAAIPADLLEAELFGVHGRVATGVDPRPGLFAQAQGGTIFLDEIGELAEKLQAKLLRVLQEREILPLGAAKPRKVDVRVVSASNRDLASCAGFRSDLYYRLRGFEIRVPPLRERREDIPWLVSAFVSRAAERYKKNILGVSRRALALLMEHSWPGNVRELQDEAERAVLLCPDGGALQSEHFRIARSEPQPPLSSPEPPLAPTLQQRVDDLERQAILDAMTACGGNKTRAARTLGLTRNGLNLKLKRLGI